MTVPRFDEPISDERGRVTRYWWHFFSAVAQAVASLDESALGANVVRIGSLQIAWGALGTITTATATGSVFRGDGAAVTFAQLFSEAPAVTLSIVSTTGCFGGGAAALSATGFTPRVYGSTATSATASGSRWLAIGRWR